MQDLINPRMADSGHWSVVGRGRQGRQSHGIVADVSQSLTGHLGGSPADYTGGIANDCYRLDRQTGIGAAEAITGGLSYADAVRGNTARRDRDACGLLASGLL